jgi:hypothetical protein
VLLRLEQHLLDPPAVLILDVGAFAESAAHVADALGETVPHSLEVRQREQARTALRGRGDAELEALARPRRREQPTKLGLQPCDLIQKRLPRRPLVGSGPRPDD